MVIRWKKRYLVEIVDSQKSVGGPCESVLLCGRWFGTGNKCGHSQTFRLIKRDCCCTRCILNEGNKSAFIWVWRWNEFLLTWMLRVKKESTLFEETNLENNRNVLVLVCECHLIIYYCMSASLTLYWGSYPDLYMSRWMAADHCVELWGRGVWGMSQKVHGWWG